MVHVREHEGRQKPDDTEVLRDASKFGMAGHPAKDGWRESVKITVSIIARDTYRCWSFQGA